MRKNNSVKVVLVFAFMVFLVLTLTSCKGNKLSNDKITYDYHKRIEAIEIINDFNEEVYLDFNIILLDENEEVLYKKTFEKEIIKEGSNYYNLEDIIPEYISYNKVDSMDLESIEVYEISYIKILILVIVIGFVANWLLDK